MMDFLKDLGRDIHMIGLETGQDKLRTLVPLQINSAKKSYRYLRKALKDTYATTDQAKHP